MEASIREMTDAKRAAADSAAADAAADAADAAAAQRNPYSHAELVNRHEARILELERRHNAGLGYGPKTNKELERYLSSRHIDNKKTRGGRTKRAKKAKRSHRHRHLKQRCRTRKH